MTLEEMHRRSTLLLRAAGKRRRGAFPRQPVNAEFKL
jgi:hypothetical protein